MQALISVLQPAVWYLQKSFTASVRLLIAYSNNMLNTRFKKLPMIHQFSQTECGIASLAMIFGYHGVNVPFEKLRDRCGASRDGIKAQVLIDIAEAHHFDACAYKVDIDEIRQLTYPIIAYWNFSHYVVIRCFKKDKVYIHDPAQGAVTVTLDEFDKAFTGIIIDITPTNNIVKTSKKFQIQPILKHVISNYKELLFILIALSLLAIIPYLDSLLIKTFIDDCIILKNSNWIPYIIILFIIFTVTLILATSQLKTKQFKLNSKISLIQSSSLFVHLLQLPLVFYSLRQRSEVVAILSRIETVITSLHKETFTLIITSFSAVTCLLCMTKINLWLTTISIFFSLIAMLLYIYLFRINVDYEKTNLNAIAKLYSHTLTTMKNIISIKSSGLESNVLQHWVNLFNNRMTINDKISTLTIFIQTILKTNTLISSLFLLILGFYFIQQGHLSVGGLIAYYSLSLIFYQSLIGLLQAAKELQSVYVTNTRFNEIKQCNKDIRYQHKNNFLVHEHQASIVLRNIQFYYNPHQPPVLNNINLNIYPGQHIALVGGTGSGKSTLAKLLCGLYQAVSGEIYFSHSFATHVAYVSQEISLFSGTILDNLTLWNDNITLIDINASIEVACLSQLISARTLQGLVEEEGRNFSGGERQRIEIARAILQNTPILILDEATSALDIATESKLIANLRKIKKTIVFVAHRLSTIRHCDQIVVLQHGNIIESGHHDELMANKGRYFSLVQAESASLL